MIPSSMPLSLHTSNDPIHLLHQMHRDHLARSEPLSPQIVVTQSQAMFHWIPLQLAKDQKIVFNIQFRLFRTLLNDLLSLSTPLNEDPYNTNILQWKIMQLLPPLLKEKSFQILKQYLDNDTNSIKFYFFCHRLSKLYDNYLIYRSDTLALWETTKQNSPSPHPHDWQRILWQKITSSFKTPHILALKEEFIALLQKQSLPLLPKTIAFFALSHLPAFYLELLEQLAQKINLSLYCYTPLRTKKITSPKDTSFSFIDRPAREQTIFFQHLSQSPLKKSSHYQSPKPHHMLNLLQKYLLDELPSPLTTDPQIQPIKQTFIARKDLSLQIHVCCDPHREVEALYHQLLFLLQKKSYTPADILIVVPDLQQYAPFIQAVFETPESPHLRIPYTIAQTSDPLESTLFKDFYALLDLLKGRLEFLLRLRLPKTRLRPIHPRLLRSNHPSPPKILRKFQYLLGRRR